MAAVTNFPRARIDHLFISTDEGAPEAQRLVEFGLREGPANTHPGQGTANRRFFFRSTMLELLWVHDAAEARAPLTRPTLLWDRWSQRRRGACPFGIMLTGGDGAAVPFASWEYKPAYLPALHAMHIASDVTLAEPMWIYGGSRQPPNRETAHPNGLRDITAVRLIAPPGAGMPVARAMAELNLISIGTGPAYLLELQFDSGLQGGQADFLPDLPLRVHW
jgi:hypothetical protein